MNCLPFGHVNCTTVPKAVSLLEANAPSPGLKSGQSAEKVAEKPAPLCRESEMNRINISPDEAVSVIFGIVAPLNPFPECNRRPETEEPSNTCTISVECILNLSKRSDRGV